MTDTARPTETQAWQALKAHYEEIKGVHLRQLFADDPARAESFSAEGAGLFLDYSKNRLTAKTIQLLLQLARERGVEARRDAMFRGEKINLTEKRAVLHVALRAPKGVSIQVDGQDVVPEVHAVLDKMSDFANRVRSGQWQGHTGKRIKNVINIGIGGSYLGPEMAYLALRPFSDRAMTCRFVSNVDGANFTEATHDLDPGETLFVISSKTFTTLETMTNAQTARQWVIKGLGREERRGQALRGGVHQRPGGSEIRHRYRQHVWLLGLGRRPLLHGLGHRALHHAGSGAGELSGDAGRLPCHG